MVYQVSSPFLLSFMKLTHAHRQNPYMARNGLCMDGVGLAAKMMENLHIDFNKQPFNHARLDADMGRLPSTQPVTPATDMRFEWERPRQQFASQPTEAPQEYDSQTLWASLAEDPTMSQFAPYPHLSLSLVSCLPCWPVYTESRVDTEC
jgi:serine/threonine-protein kinase Chk1